MLSLRGVAGARLHVSGGGHMTAQITPGPWTVRAHPAYSGFLIIGGLSFTITVVTEATDLTPEQGEQRKRDAKAIAAVPAMVEALKVALPLLRDRIHSDPADQVEDALKLAGILPPDCPGHVASDSDPRVCRHCGTHVDEYRDEPEQAP